MQPELVLKAISHTVIALSFTAILFFLLISLRKEITQGTILAGIVHLCLAAIGIFAFVALVTVYFHARKVVVPYSVSQQLKTAFVSGFSRF
jgi:hypothetical protein